MLYLFPSIFVIGILKIVSCELNEWRPFENPNNLVLPEGVEIFQTETKEWSELGAWLITANIETFNKSGGWNLESFISKNSASKLSTVREFASDYDTIIATNGGFFGTSNGVGSSYSLAAKNFNLLSPNLEKLTRSGVSYFPTRCALGIDADLMFDAYWVYKSSSNGTWSYDIPSPNKENYPPQPVPNEVFPTVAKEWNIRAGVGGGPMLVFDSANVAMSSFDAEVMWGSGVPSDVAAARTAIGFSSKQLLWIAVDGEENTRGISLPDLAEEFIKLDAKKACNLDGGGSTQLVVDKTLINLPDGGTYERPVAVAVMLF